MNISILITTFLSILSLTITMLLILIHSLEKHAFLLVIVIIEPLELCSCVIQDKIKLCSKPRYLSFGVTVQYVFNAKKK